jgi:hypothetical protein
VTTPRRRAVLLVAALLLAVTGSVLGLLLSTTSEGAPAAASSYCDASRAVLDYHGHDGGRAAALLDRVAQLAPTDIAPEVRVMRASRPSSSRYDGARLAWRRYDTNHCCDCIGGPNVPVVVTAAP